LATADETRGRLLEAAIVEFAEHGFDGATLRDICARAEVNLNAVKYHFRDKQGLYVAAVQQAHAAAKQMEPEPVMPAEGAAGRLRAFIAGLLRMALAAEHESYAHQLLMMREMINPTQATEEIVRSFIKPRFAQLDAILSELLPPGTPTIERRLLALSVVGQCLHYKIGRRIDQLIIAPSEYRRFTLPRLTEHVTGVILAAIEAQWRASSEPRASARGVK
jgi:AcrR family transcriptional regulator